MFRVKICGVTSIADAHAIAAAGADAIGLNFIPGSPRCLTVEQATAIAASLPETVLTVGVFVGRPPSEMLAIAKQVGLAAIQLHGLFDGPPEASDPPWRCAELQPYPVIRAVRLDEPSADPDRLATARQWIDAAAACGTRPAMALVDAGVSRGTSAGLLGGTGHTVEWESVAATPPLPIPTTLAGGLTPENVAMAVRTSRMAAVDTASGVEAAPGRKDPDRVARFVAAARAAFAASASMPGTP
jgi:phosphoribosylanthranilate isomerase